MLDAIPQQFLPFLPLFLLKIFGQIQVSGKVSSLFLVGIDCTGDIWYINGYDAKEDCSSWYSGISCSAGISYDCVPVGEFEPEDIFPWGLTKEIYLKLTNFSWVGYATYSDDECSYDSVDMIELTSSQCLEYHNGSAYVTGSCVTNGNYSQISNYFCENDDTCDINSATCTGFPLANVKSEGCYYDGTFSYQALCDEHPLDFLVKYYWTGSGNVAVLWLFTF